MWDIVDFSIGLSYGLPAYVSWGYEDNPYAGVNFIPPAQSRTMNLASALFKFAMRSPSSSVTISE
jgi:hypothetical protein